MTCDVQQCSCIVFHRKIDVRARFDQQRHTICTQSVTHHTLQRITRHNASHVTTHYTSQHITRHNTSHVTRLNYARRMRNAAQSAHWSRAHENLHQPVCTRITHHASHVTRHTSHVTRNATPATAAPTQTTNPPLRPHAQAAPEAEIGTEKQL